MNTVSTPKPLVKRGNMKPKYMMATKAFAKLGDISREKPDLCCVHEDDGNNYIGNWVTGLGFFNVKFPHDTTRDLTTSEIRKYNKLYVQINNQPPIKLKVGGTK